LINNSKNTNISNTNISKKWSSIKESKKQKYCKFCKKNGHIEENCFLKHPELKQQKQSSIDIKNKDRSSILYINKEEYNQYSFVIDLGASEHYTSYKEWLKDYTNKSKIIYIANRESLNGYGYRDIDLILYIKNKEYPVKISKVWYILNLIINLFSTKSIADKGWNIEFSGQNALISNKDKSIFGQGY
jgi:hypothetical protein